VESLLAAEKLASNKIIKTIDLMYMGIDGFTTRNKSATKKNAEEA
jgi:hypothetical protein